MQLHWHAAALAELENILDHAAARDPLEARNIATQIARTEDTIRTFWLACKTTLVWPRTTSGNL